MRTKSPRRQKLPALPVPQTLDEANTLLEQMGRLQREQTKAEDALKQAISDKVAAAAPEMQERQTKIDDLTHALRAYAEASRAELTAEGAKSVSLPQGEIGWRIDPPSVKVRGEEAVLDALTRLGLTEYIRTTLAINKQAILADRSLSKGQTDAADDQARDAVKAAEYRLALLHQVEGLTLVSGVEVFFAAPLNLATIVEPA